MKNLFERETVDEVISRIDTLRPTTPRQWGKMDVPQMLAHCSAAMDMASDRLKLPRRFIDDERVSACEQARDPESSPTYFP